MDQFASGYKSWDVHIKDESFLKVFDNKDIVFLAAESPNVLTGNVNGYVPVIM